MFFKITKKKQRTNPKNFQTSALPSKTTQAPVMETDIKPLSQILLGKPTICR